MAFYRTFCWQRREVPSAGEAAVCRFVRCGYTIVELMVTMAIVSIVAATVGMFFVKLLTIQEREREDGYIREKLSGICAAYADALSVGASLSTNYGISSNQETTIKYRMETGGVSLETGLVTHVAYLTSMMNFTNRTVDLDVYAFEPGGLARRLSRNLNGDAPLIPLIGDMVSCTITPLNANVWEDDGVLTTDAALAYLEVSARYAVETADREIVTNTATAGRVVRLWNRE